MHDGASGRAGPEHVLAADLVRQALQLRIPGIQLMESVVVLNAAKRVGWMLNPDSTATGAVVVPSAELVPTA